MGIIKQISVYNGNQWQTNYIGANADKITVATPLLGRSSSDAKDLESLLSKAFPTTQLQSEKVLIADNSGKIVSTDISVTKLNYLRNVTYDIDAKIANVDANINIKDGQKIGSLRTVGSAEEVGTYRLGEHALAEGYGTKANGNYSHAQGQNTQAQGFVSHAQGIGTIASSSYQTALGKYNTTETNYAVMLGNGTADNDRSNAATIDWSGNVEISGKLNDEALVSQETLNKWNEILDID